MGTIPRFLEMVDLDFFIVAMPYTLLDQDVLDAEFPQCEERGVGVVIGAVFASGILATGATENAYYAYAPAPLKYWKKRGASKLSAIDIMCRYGSCVTIPAGTPDRRCSNSRRAHARACSIKCGNI